MARGSQGFGYAVSRRQREKEIVDNNAWIEQIDRTLGAGIVSDGFDKPSGEAWSVVEMVAVTPVFAARCGLSAEDVVALKWKLGIECEAPAPAGWYARAERIAEWLEAAYGEWLQPSAKLKAERAVAVRRRGAARRAIDDGRAF